MYKNSLAFNGRYIKLISRVTKFYLEYSYWTVVSDFGSDCANNTSNTKTLLRKHSNDIRLQVTTLVQGPQHKPTDIYYN